jgi:hypothetical protein
MSKAREIRDLMKSLGFTLLRKNRHFIWTDGKVKIVTAATPSCKHALENIRHEILRRKDKEGTA